MPVPSLIKQPSESRLFGMDFAARLGNDELLTVTSVSASPTGLTLSGSPGISGTEATQRIAGGTSGVKYKVTFVVVTAGGNTLEGEGILQVKDL